VICVASFGPQQIASLRDIAKDENVDLTTLLMGRFKRKTILNPDGSKVVSLDELEREIYDQVIYGRITGTPDASTIADGLIKDAKESAAKKIAENITHALEFMKLEIIIKDYQGIAEYLVRDPEKQLHTIRGMTIEEARKYLDDGREKYAEAVQRLNEIWKINGMDKADLAQQIDGLALGRGMKVEHAMRDSADTLWNDHVVEELRSGLESLSEVNQTRGRYDLHTHQESLVGRLRATIDVFGVGSAEAVKLGELMQASHWLAIEPPPVSETAAEKPKS
jgi:hypothetical protein